MDMEHMHIEPTHGVGPLPLGHVDAETIIDPPADTTTIDDDATRTIRVDGGRSKVWTEGARRPAPPHFSAQSKCQVGAP